MPRRPKRNDVVVKMDAEAVRLARVIAGATNKPLAEILTDAALANLRREAARVKKTLPDAKDS